MKKLLFRGGVNWCLKKQKQTKGAENWNRVREDSAAKSLKSREREGAWHELKCSGLHVRCCLTIFFDILLGKNSRLVHELCKNMMKTFELYLFRKVQWPDVYTSNKDKSSSMDSAESVFLPAAELCDHCSEKMYTG